MEKIKLLDQMFASYSTEASISGFILGLILTLIFSNILAVLYVKYGQSISNRKQFATLFMPIAGTTMLIITMVKSSVALSLGLVGALSIVRFRAAIKEPEELTYLFLAIGLGLGFGSNNISLTIIGVFIIGVALAIKNKNRNSIEETLAGISITTSGQPLDLQKLNSILSENCNSIHLKRFDKNSTSSETIFYVQLKGLDSLDKISQRMGAEYPQSDLVYIDHSSLS